MEGDVREINSMSHFFEVPKGVGTIVIHAAGIVTIASKYEQFTETIGDTLRWLKEQGRI